MKHDEISNLTDEQINVMVTKCVYNVHDHEYAEKGKEVTLKRGDAICDGGVTVCGGALYKFDRLGLSFYSVKDYCNDPAVMWPIIIENGISIIKHEDYHTFTAFVAAGIDDAEHDIWMMADHRADDINPLRAAAIVYLKINGVL